jgi:hypothetical protein
MDMTVADKAKLPFTKIDRHQIDCNFQGMGYSLKALKGFFTEPDGDIVFRIYPEKSTFILSLSDDK